LGFGFVYLFICVCGGMEDMLVYAVMLAMLAILRLIYYAVMLRLERKKLLSCDDSIAFVKDVKIMFEKYQMKDRHGFIEGEHAIRKCLLDLNLRVSNVMVNDLMRRAAKSHGPAMNKCVELGDFILFVRLVRDFKESTACKQQAKRAIHHRLALNQNNHGLTPAHRTRKRTQYQVFLGGSCNPTTWRMDVAIPMLKDKGITYYNPQVDFWEPSLVELEQQAKKNAQLLFFVIDNRTRGLASMVEIAHLAASGAQLIVVMQDFDESSTIDGNAMSPSEVIDLNRGHDFLCHLLHQNGIPLFDDVLTAMSYVTRVINKGESIFDLADVPYVFEPVIRGADVTMLDSTHTVMRHYDERNRGSLTRCEAHLALKTLLGVSLGEKGIDRFLKAIGSEVDDNGVISKSGFFAVVASLLPASQEEASGSSLAKWLYNWIKPEVVSEVALYDMERDVFLGGACGPLQQWREDAVIPLLRKNGLDYFNPNVSNWTPQLIPLEAQAKEQCAVLFFYVGSDTRAVGTMVEAAHFIGRGRNVVICMADVKASCVVDNTELGAHSAKDLNRGRLYLADIANREGLKQFTNITEAAHELVNIGKAMRLSVREAEKQNDTSTSASENNTSSNRNTGATTGTNHATDSPRTARNRSNATRRASRGAA